MQDQADAGHQLARRKVFRIEPQLARLDRRDVQHVLDQGHQAAGRGLDGAHAFALLLVQAGGGQQLGHAGQAIERGAELVAHVGQEAALGLAGPARRFGGAGQLPQQARQVQRYRRQAHQQPDAQLAHMRLRPVIVEQQHAAKAGKRHGHGQVQVVVAIAQAVADGDPHHHHVDPGQWLAHGDHARRHQAVVGQHAHDPAHVRTPGPGQQPGEDAQAQHQAGQYDRQHALVLLQVRLGPRGRQQHETQDQQDQHDAHDRLAVLAVGPVAQPPAHPVHHLNHGPVPRA